MLENCKSYDVTNTQFFPQRSVGLTGTLLPFNMRSVIMEAFTTVGILVKTFKKKSMGEK